MKTILGLSLGTRIAGLALCRDSYLIEWKVKSFKGHWTDGKLRDILHILKTVMSDYDVTCVVAKKPDIFRTSSALEELISELRVLCNRQKISFTMYSLKAMKYWYKESGVITKSEMIKLAMEKYPEVYAAYNKEQRLKHGYYTKVFEAIILTGKSIY